MLEPTDLLAKRFPGKIDKVQEEEVDYYASGGDSAYIGGGRDALAISGNFRYLRFLTHPRSRAKEVVPSPRKILVLHSLD